MERGGTRQCRESACLCSNMYIADKVARPPTEESPHQRGYRGVSTR